MTVAAKAARAAASGRAICRACRAEFRPNTASRAMYCSVACFLATRRVGVHVRADRMLRQTSPAEREAIAAEMRAAYVRAQGVRE